MKYDELKRLFDKCSFLVTNVAYEQYINGQKILGVPKNGTQTTFVTSKDRADEIMNSMEGKELDEQKKIYADGLGFDPENLLKNSNFTNFIQLNVNGKEVKDHVVKDKIEIIKDFEIRLPDGTEPGVNDFWIAGGFTSGGKPEMVINALPNASIFIPEVYTSRINDSVRLKDDHKYGPICF